MRLEAVLPHLSPQVQMVGFHRATPGWVQTGHLIHEDVFDFWFVTRGRGQMRVDDRVIALEPSQLVTIRPGQSIADTAASRDDPWDIYYLYVKAFESGYDDEAYEFAQCWPTLLHLPHEAAAVQHRFDHALEVFLARPPGAMLTLKVAVLEILSLVLPMVYGQESQASTDALHTLDRVRLHIDRHASEPHTLRSLSKMAGFSPSYFGAAFRKAFGVSPIEYLIHRRLIQSQLLLVQGASVSKAASASGFSSLHYFSRLFKQRFGQTPRQFVHQAQFLGESQRSIDS